MSLTTPICDFVGRYKDSGTVRAHMPGHKGRLFLGCEDIDITEIKGADALYEAEGIIAESERNASFIFGSGHTYYSTEGSSQCIKAMLFLAMGQQHREKGERPLILAARNVHKAFVHACALLDIDVEWLMPEAEGLSVCSCPISANSIRKKLAVLEKRPFALYLTSPDYLGGTADLAGISEICRRSGMLLLVDNAHGAYLKFLEKSRHPLDLGADMCCDSAHKTLPALTGAAYLQVSKDILPQLNRDPRQALGMFGSTSPSYLILQSLDLCNRLISEGYDEKIRRAAQKITKLAERLSELGFDAGCPEGDPLKLVVRDVRGGTWLAQRLREKEIEVEFADSAAVVMMLSPANSDDDFEKIYASLKDIGAAEKGEFALLPALTRPERVMTIREAVFAAGESIPVTEAEGRICAALTISCPPAVPIAVSGEKITEEEIKILLAYGIDRVDVVK